MLNTKFNSEHSVNIWLMFKKKMTVIITIQLLQC